MTDWTPEEDEAFNDVEKHSNLGKQILRETFNKSSGMDCCTYDCIQGRNCPVRKAQWINLSDKEILTAYGWDDLQVSEILLKDYRKLILSGLRGIEKAIWEKNT